ncbi:MAG: caa(3)-type oxidase subunit IV [Gemmatimonadetes bacterium]|nr:caa(3)-type oxidase subunit IV [Gemmatimonadota bacterium]
MSSHSKAGDGHDHGGHVVSLKVLIGTWAALVVLTVVTVAATWIDLGSLNILLAMLIAVVKSALVVLLFMHLLWDKPFHSIIFLSSTLFVALFISFALMDTREYEASKIPGYSPEMEIAAQEAAASATDGHATDGDTADDHAPADDHAAEGDAH